MIPNSDLPDTAPIPKPGVRHYWLIGGLLAAIGLAVLPLDIWLANPGNLEYLPGDLKRFVDLSELFAHGFGVGIIAIGIWMLASTQRKYIPRIVACAFWPAAGVSLLKICFVRFRPIKYFNEFNQAVYPASITETWLGWLPEDKLNVIYATQSFPSAHTATTWGLAIGMSWVFPKGRWLFCVIAILASMQRVASFAHWSSDVFFGAAIAFVMAGALTQNWGFGYWLGRLENREQPELKLIINDENVGQSKRAA